MDVDMRHEGREMMTVRNLMGQARSAIVRAIIATIIIASASPLVAQQDSALTLPFAIGEKFVYSGRSQSLGNIGKGEMWIEGPVDVRGVSTWLLRFDFRAGIGPVGGSNRSSSWIEPTTMSAMRFSKREKRFLSGKEETVEMFPGENRWTSSAGRSGTGMSAQPLDELSYIFFVRTLPLEEGVTYTFDRHFDAARNPTTIRVTGRESIETKAGTFRTIRVEMIVKDSRNYDKVGLITLFLSDDERRIPVRIESDIPLLGHAVLTLESQTVAGRNANVITGTR
jgi:hypothetical protein